MATQSKKPSAPKTKKADAPEAEVDTEVEAAEVEVEEPEAEVETVESDDADEAGELTPEDELDIERLDTALATLDDESLRRGLAGVTEKQRLELAGLLNLPRATMHLGEALVPLVRRKLRALPLDRQLSVATALTNRVNDATVRALGDRSDDPSRADLEEVLPAVVDAHGVELARLMLASYAVSDAPCREAMRSLLDEDERFALPEAPPAEADAGEAVLPSFGLVAQVPRKKADADPERAKLLEQRKVQKAERRAAAGRERAAKAAALAARRQALHASKRANHPG